MTTFAHVMKKDYDNSPVTSSPTVKGAAELFELINKLQSSRLNDQRCALPAILDRGEDHKGSAVVRKQYHSNCGTGGGTSLTRLNDNNCEVTDNVRSTKELKQQRLSHILSQILANGKPYPTVVLPKNVHQPTSVSSVFSPEDEYWCDPPSGRRAQTFQAPPTKLNRKFNLEADESSYRAYRSYFMGYEHLNFSAQDSNLGPLIVSIKVRSGSRCKSKEQNCSDDGCVKFISDKTHIIVRSCSGTSYQTIPPSFDHDVSKPLETLRLVCPELDVEKLSPLLYPRASDMIVTYDEHVLVNSYKFGIIYQRVGQIEENELFGNTSHSKTMGNFLSLIGRKIDLEQHSGYRGGLDTSPQVHTGRYSLYEIFRNREIMFHVSTLLPHRDQDQQHLQKKRHIGNDIVALIFQDDNTPFSPQLITSNFLHAFIIVTAVDFTAKSSSQLSKKSVITTNNNNHPDHFRKQLYRVSVVAKHDVPNFGPPLPDPPIFEGDARFKDFLITKLINAENACYKASKFAMLQKRTRRTLLTNLVNELQHQTDLYTLSLTIRDVSYKSNDQTHCSMYPNHLSDSSTIDSTSSSTSSSNNSSSFLMNSFKKAFGGYTVQNNDIGGSDSRSCRTPTFSSLDYINHPETSIDLYQECGRLKKFTIADEALEEYRNSLLASTSLDLSSKSSMSSMDIDISQYKHNIGRKVKNTKGDAGTGLPRDHDNDRKFKKRLIKAPLIENKSHVEDRSSKNISLEDDSGRSSEFCSSSASDSSSSMPSPKNSNGENKDAKAHSIDNVERGHQQRSTNHNVNAHSVENSASRIDAIGTSSSYSSTTTSYSPERQLSSSSSIYAFDSDENDGGSSSSSISTSSIMIGSTEDSISKVAVIDKILRRELETIEQVWETNGDVKTLETDKTAISLNAPNSSVSTPKDITQPSSAEAEITNRHPFFNVNQLSDYIQSSDFAHSSDSSKQNITTVPVEVSITNPLTPKTANSDSRNIYDYQVNSFEDDLFRLRQDKLKLLEQNLSVEHEVNALRNRQLQMQSDLILAAREIQRLRNKQKKKMIHERKIIVNEIINNNSVQPSERVNIVTNYSDGLHKTSVQIRSNVNETSCSNQNHCPSEAKHESIDQIEGEVKNYNNCPTTENDVSQIISNPYRLVPEDVVYSRCEDEEFEL